MINNKKIFIFGCKHTTIELIKGLQNSIEVDGLLTISKEAAKKNKVAGFFDLRDFSKENDLELLVTDDYSLKEESTKDKIIKLNLDLVLVNGWQRLLPDWLLSSLSIGAFGMHGSNKPLPHGRGRSPLNWSIIQNKKVFFTHLFKYLPGIDDGPIVDYQKFEINYLDSALTLHYKNTLSMIKLCERNLLSLVNHEANLKDQNKDIKATFYPKREENDGVIFWEDSTEDIYNLIRAVTRPFPGAFSFLQDTKLLIWKAQPFDNHIHWEGVKFGQILEVFNEGNFIVKTGDGTMLVTDYEGKNISLEDKGSILDSRTFERKIWEDLPN